MPKIVQYNLPPGGTVVQVADNQVALEIESTDAKDYITIDTTDGSEKLVFNSGQPGIAAQVGVSNRGPRISGTTGAAYPAYNFIGDEDTGMTHLGTSNNDQLSLIAGGVEGIRVVKDASSSKIHVGINGAPEDQNNPVLQLTGDGSEAELIIRRNTLSSSNDEVAYLGYRAQSAFSIDAEGGIQFRNQGGSKRAEFDSSGNFTTYHTTTVSGAALSTVGAFATTGGGTVGTGGSSDATLEQSGASTFQTALHVGAAIKIVDSGDGEVFLRTVASITDANTLEMDEAAVVENGSAWYHDSGELFAVKTGDSKTLFGVNENGAIQAGSAAGGDSEKNNLGFGDADTFDAVTTGHRNYVIGHSADNYKITTGYRNILMGWDSGSEITTATSNVIIGDSAGVSCNAIENTYVGAGSGLLCTGEKNTAVGNQSFRADGAADKCVAVGYNSLYANLNDQNIGVGYRAGQSLTTGQDCTFLGTDADAASTATADNQTAIGKGAVAHGANTVTLGNASVTSIDSHSDRSCDLGTTSYEYDAVHCVSVTEVSDERLKEDITDSVMGLDFINSLRPVSYKFKDIERKTEVVTRTEEKIVIGDDGTETTETVTEDQEVIVHPGKTHNRKHQGLLAQEVKASLDAAGIDTADFGGFVDANVVDGVDKLALRYNQFIGPLIKAVQELTARVAELEAGE